jgi:biotin transport system substrate-specific component
MGISTTWNKIKLNFYTRRANLALSEKIFFSLILAAAVAVSAQIRIPLLFTPVPVTMQTVAVFTGAVILGRYWGGIAFLLYIILGMAGLPVFTGFKSGAAALIGPTGGYLAGFAISAFIIGHLTDKYTAARKPLNLFIIMLISNFLIVHAIGMIQLNLWMNITPGNQFGLKELFFIGSFPFITGDIVKIFISAMIASSLSPGKKIIL